MAFQATMSIGNGQKQAPAVERLGGRVAAVVGAVAIGAVLGVSTPSNALIEVPGCYNGVGSGCESQAEGNPLILELQRKTAEKREAREKEMREEYWRKGYTDYFKVGSNKDLVQNEDGTWELRTPETPESRFMKSLMQREKKE